MYDISNFHTKFTLPMEKIDCFCPFALIRMNSCIALRFQDAVRQNPTSIPIHKDYPARRPQ